jgi:hypothetical protein
MHYKNEKFENRDEILDGNTYEDCFFRNCRLIYDGGELPTFIGQCAMVPRVEWSLGGRAKNTLDFLRFMWRTGGENGMGFTRSAFEYVTGSKISIERQQG